MQFVLQHLRYPVLKQISKELLPVAWSCESSVNLLLPAFLVEAEVQVPLLDVSSCRICRLSIQGVSTQLDSDCQAAVTFFSVEMIEMVEMQLSTM